MGYGAHIDARYGQQSGEPLRYSGQASRGRAVVPAGARRLPEGMGPEPFVDAFYAQQPRQPLRRPAQDNVQEMHQKLVGLCQKILGQIIGIQSSVGKPSKGGTSTTQQSGTRLSKEANQSSKENHAEEGPYHGGIYLLERISDRAGYGRSKSRHTVSLLPWRSRPSVESTSRRLVCRQQM